MKTAFHFFVKVDTGYFSKVRKIKKGFQYDGKSVAAIFKQRTIVKSLEAQTITKFTSALRHRRFKEKLIMVKNFVTTNMMPHIVFL